MDLTRLQELKRKLLNEAQFAPVWAFFLDHFGENLEFMRLGGRAHHPLVEAVVAEVGQQLFAGEGAVTELLLTSLPEEQFIHGGFMMGRRVGGVFYFEDVHVGLAVVTDLPPSVETKYARFSGRPLRKPGEPSQN